MTAHKLRYVSSIFPILLGQPTKQQSRDTVEYLSDIHHPFDGQIWGNLNVHIADRHQEFSELLSP